MMCAWREPARQRREQQALSIPADWRLKAIPGDFKDCRPVIESGGILSAEELATVRWQEMEGF